MQRKQKQEKQRSGRNWRSCGEVLGRLEAVLPANERPGEVDEEAQMEAWAEVWRVRRRVVEGGVGRG